MASPDDWEFDIGNAAGPFASVAEAVYHFYHDLSQSLKSFPTAPYVTRGSSVNGTSGSAHSTIPDGVDRWSGLNYAQAANGNTIWHVLQNTLTGFQTALRIGPVSLEVSQAINKYETGGAWRAGVSTSVRPSDNVTTPVETRETSAARNHSGSFDTNYEFNFVNRKDGLGFYAWMWPDDNDPGKAHFVSNFPLTNSPANDLNPFMSASIAGGWLADPDILNISLSGRLIADTNLKTYTPFKMADRSANTLLNGEGADPDPFISEFPAFIFIFGVTGSNPRHFKGTAPDLFLLDTTIANNETWNGLSYLKIGGLAVPWDGSTSRGTDRTFYFDLVSISDLSQTPSVGNLRKFNTGLEVL